MKAQEDASAWEGFLKAHTVQAIKKNVDILKYIKIKKFYL
jgi:hypothetical protein